ncbi:MAG: M48 family metallopeptidase [Oscillospiraceae bacterium]|nr:M48 family metallopeptidase [Oscillospiraceae bacterium]
MDIYKLYLNEQNGTVIINILRKNIKNIHLKVFRDLNIKLSVPCKAPNDFIINLLNQKAAWINIQITKYKMASGYNNLDNIKSGASTQFLGKDIRIYKKLSLENSVEIDEKSINICIKDIDDKELGNKLFNKFWRMQADEIFKRELDELYRNIFKKYNIEKPSIIIKKMKTLWGSCTKTKNKITLNEYLLKADIRCIQYVILHELSHLLYTYHSVDFYNFMTVQMPDWRERKNQLDKEVVQGL